MVRERIAGKRSRSRAVVLCFALSASCRCALLAGLLAALVACFAGLLGRRPRSVLRMVQVFASSGFRDQSFMNFMLSCVAVAVSGCLFTGHIPCIFPWFWRGSLCLSQAKHTNIIYETGVL